MKNNLAALLAGTLFGLGLALSQMLNPDKVISFLDVTGDWDPSLAFVMLGALSITIPGFRFILQRSTPVLTNKFQLTNKSAITRPLVMGAGLFGVGWGLSGYCPGPAVASLGLLSVEGFIMVVAICAGFYSYHWVANK